jgi:hypothetical protein
MLAVGSVLVSYDDDARAGDVHLEHPDLHYAISRAQYLDRLPLRANPI